MKNSLLQSGGRKTEEGKFIRLALVAEEWLFFGFRLYFTVLFFGVFSVEDRLRGLFPSRAWLAQ